MKAVSSSEEYDAEAVAWAIKKLRNFGVAQSAIDNALMMDRLELMHRQMAAQPAAEGEGK